ncbi:hypothetical protein [Chitinibacter tainanensis]|uniref:hypothetical protein n=1 Tax=Chitinibacter tainanensis TaxID=230667 RepID=UPI0004909491|nr:hypothetical protein [Chitinibacter tainanensis]
MLRALPIALTAILIAGCASKPADFKDSDFNIKTVTIKAPIDEVLENFYQNGRKCEAGVAQCFQRGQKATCDIYAPAFGGGPSHWVIGIIELRGSENETTADVKAHKVHDRPNNYRERWSQMLEKKLDQCS